MLDTPSVFDSLELDDTTRRVAQRRALALAHTRVENRMGSFLRGATSEEEFEERLALILDDFDGAVRTASSEVGYDKPEHVASSLKQHYAAAVNFDETPAQEEEDEEDDEKAPKASAVDSDSTPRTASVKAGEWLLTPHTGADDYMQDPRVWDQHGGPGVYPAGYGDERAQQPQPHAFQDAPQGPMSVPAVTGQPPVDPSDPRYQEWLMQQQQQVPGQVRASFLDDGWTVRAYAGEMPPEYQGQQQPAGPSTPTPMDPSQLSPEALQRYLGDPSLSEHAKQLMQQQAVPPNAAAPAQNELSRAFGYDQGPQQYAAKTADGHGNTGLAGPEPKMDKSHKPLTGQPEGASDKQIDVVQPIVPKDRTESDLTELGDIKHEKLPAADGDDAGFSTKTPGGKGDKTKTFPKGDQTNPVTHETISNSGFPTTGAVQSALTRL